MTQLLAAMATAQLFRTLVVAGAELHFCLLISCRHLGALHIEQADLAVAALADHLAAGGAVSRVTGPGAGVGASGGAGLGAALLTRLTLLAVANHVTLPTTAVIATGQGSPTGSLT